jgi:hypothetical protein
MVKEHPSSFKFKNLSGNPDAKINNCFGKRVSIVFPRPTYSVMSNVSIQLCRSSRFYPHQLLPLVTRQIHADTGSRYSSLFLAACMPKLQLLMINSIGGLGDNLADFV